MAKKKCPRCFSKVDTERWLTHLDGCSGPARNTGPFASDTPLDPNEDYTMQDDISGFMPDAPAAQTPYYGGTNSGQYRPMDANSMRIPVPPPRVNPNNLPGASNILAQQQDAIVDGYYYHAGGQRAPRDYRDIYIPKSGLGSSLAAQTPPAPAAAAASSSPSFSSNSAPTGSKRSSKRQSGKTPKKPKKSG